MILCYITDRRQFSGDLLSKISEAVAAGVEYLQIREKDLSARALEDLARAAANRGRGQGISATRILINSRTDVALATGLHGVHLPSQEIPPKEIRRIWSNAVVGVSCHSVEEVKVAAAEGADFALFGPVFEKATAMPQGLDRLSQASRNGIPVLALGGITVSNAQSCITAGAAGIAAIRLFQENHVASLVKDLRA